jgi:urease accessory protein
MLRAVSVQRSLEADTLRVIDRVVLDADERHRRRVVLVGEQGIKFLLDLPQALALRDGDALVLDDGSIVLVAGKPEPVLEIEARSSAELARLAWHIGNRHTEVQIVGEKLRIRRDHVLEKMLRHLGAKVSALDAPFDPESGAYGQAMGQLAGHGLGRTALNPDGQTHSHASRDYHHGEKS